MPLPAKTESASRIAFALCGSCLLTAVIYFASPFVQLAEIVAASDRGDGRALALFVVRSSIQKSLHGSQEICKNWAGKAHLPNLNRCEINIEMVAGAFRNADLDAGGRIGVGATWSAFRYCNVDCFLATRISLSDPGKAITFEMARIDAFRWRLVAILPRHNAAHLRR